jgi:hypothetical protein
MQETMKGCETFGDLGWGDRRYILQGAISGVKYGEMRSSFSTIALSNYSSQRMASTHGRAAYFTGHR